MEDEIDDNPRMEYDAIMEDMQIMVREISKIVREGKAAGIPVGICGEIAADSWFSKFIGKLGCDYISVSGDGQ